MKPNLGQSIPHHPKEIFKVEEFERLLSLLTTLKGHEEFLLNEKGVIISTNLEAVNVTGYEEHEIIGKHISIFYQTEDKWMAEEDLKNSILVNNNVITGIRKKKRGTLFWAKMRIKLRSDESLKRLYRVTLQDATHRELSNIRVQSLRDDFLTLFDNPFVGAFKYRRSDSRVMMCNKKVLNISGKSEIEYFYDTFSSQEQWNEFTSILDKDGFVEGFQFIINDKRVPDNWGLISARCNENSGSVWGVIMDISEQYNQMAELERVNTELESFIYHASHDLRAPLATIMGLANLGLKETISDNNLRSYFQMIRQRVSHLDVILKDLTSISYNNNTHVTGGSFMFKEEVDSILFDHADRSGVVVTEVIQQHEFYSDVVRLRTILRNLISNSLKYSNLENRIARVRLKIIVLPGHASIQLQDNGIGIDREFKTKIFEMFFRGTTVSNGTGLGLYIVKSMLEKLHGKISVESTLNEGTTFLLIIPNSKKGLLPSDN